MVKKIVIGVAATILIGVAAFYFLRDNEVEKIKFQLTELARLASKNENEKTTTTIIKYQSLQKVFGAKCEFRIGIGQFDGIFSNLELVNMINHANMYLYSSSLRASDISVFMIDEAHAQADFTGEFRARSRGGDYIEEVRFASAKLEKIDGEWLITSIAIQNVLEK